MAVSRVGSYNVEMEEESILADSLGDGDAPSEVNDSFDTHAEPETVRKVQQHVHPASEETQGVIPPPITNLHVEHAYSEIVDERSYSDHRSEKENSLHSHTDWHADPKMEVVKSESNISGNVSVGPASIGSVRGITIRPSLEVASDTVLNLEMRELTRKYAAAVNGLQKCRSELAYAHRENAKMRKVLEREVGSTEGVAEALGVRHSDKWRGRAEEIADLKRKLKQASHVVPTVSVVVDQRRTMELEETIDLLHAELNETRKLKMALKCRNESLESQLQRMKQDLKLLLEKDAVNDELIRELKLSQSL